MIVSITSRWRRAAATAAVALGAASLTGEPSAAEPPAGPSRTVIVEVSADATISAASGRGRLDAQAAERVRDAGAAVATARRRVTDAAKQAGIKLAHRRSFQVLMPGMAVEVPANQVDDLRRLPGVRAVHEVTTFRARTVDSVPLINAPDLWRRTDSTGRPARGSGVTIAVIDTGVDYTHPSLGSGFGPDHKVVGGYDFVNDDPDPMDDNGHGTHVAGIVAGTGAGGDRAVTGVAPDATLTAYKVLDQFGSGTTEDVLAALEAAVDPANPHRADVINMSLGAPGDGTDPVGLAASRAAAAGVVVVAAAGNEGPQEQTVGTPAAADGVIAVGASTSGLRLPVADLVSPRRERVQTFRSVISANPPDDPVTADVVDVGEGTPADFDRAGDVRGKVVLVYRPQLLIDPFDAAPFIEAERRGAVAAIGHLPGAPHLPFDATSGDVPVQPAKRLGIDDNLRLDRLVLLGMDGDQYRQIRALLDEGPVRMTISGEDVTDRMASFSSRGPDLRWNLKPEIVAPGVEIRSSVPTSLWEPGVARFSGTSMAAPHVAGAAALLRQLWPDAPSERIRAALIGSARPTPDAGPTAAGAGRLDISAALSTTVTADPPALSFGLADLSGDRVTTSRTVTLRNHGSTSLPLRLDVAPGPGSPGEAKVTPRKVTVPPKGERTVTVRLSVPTPEQGRADVSGWLTVDAPKGTADLRVPYLLAVRTPGVYVTPDPSGGQSQAFIFTVEPAVNAPKVAVRSSTGRTTTVEARHDFGLWWRAPLSVKEPGAYEVTVTVPVAGGTKLIGHRAFEVADIQDTGKWELIGPNSAGGRLATTPADPDRLAVTVPYTAGVWLTTDRARTWHYRRLTPVAAGDATVVIDPKQADRMYAAVNGDGDPTYQGRLLRSDDAGRTWRVLPFPDIRIDAFAQDPTGTVLVAVTGDAVWSSRDGGETWTPTPAPWAGGVNDLAFVGSDLYVASYDGVWRWADLSGTPHLVRPTTDGFATAPKGLAAAGDLLAVAQFDGHVFGTTDGGRTWGHLLETTDLATVVGAGDALFVDAGQPYLSRDQGRTWTPVSKPVEAPIIDLAHWPEDDTLLFGAELAGVFASDDGKAFTRIGVPGQPADRMLVTGQNLLVGTPVDLYRAQLPGDPAGLEWGLSGGEGRIGHAVRGLAVSPDDPRTLWALYQNGYLGMRLMRSTDAGHTWSMVLLNDLTPVAGLLVHPADARRLVIPYRDLEGAGLYVSGDGGATWKRINHQTQYAAVAGDPRDPDRLWLGGPDGLWRSDDGGVTRVKVLDDPVTAIHLDGDRIIVGGDTIRISKNGGRSFADAHRIGGRTTLPMRVSQFVAVGNTLYASTAGFSEAGLLVGGRGVLRSVNGGRNWVNIGAGLPDPSVRSLAASPDGQWLFAGTDSGVYRLQIGR